MNRCQCIRHEKSYVHKIPHILNVIRTINKPSNISHCNIRTRIRNARFAIHQKAFHNGIPERL